jgi:hypothetical protein
MTQLLTPNRLAVLVSTILLVSLATPVMLAGGVAAQDAQQCSPELSVTYDEFRTDQSVIDRANTSDDAAVTTKNTRTTVSQGNGFVRAGFENPNSYCVAFEMQISEDIATPSTLGKVSGANSTIEADWEATHDFESDETYTTVRVILPAETNVLFAPSELRVKSLAWTSDANRAADSLRERLSDGFGFGSKLDSRHYELTGDEGEMLTVDLTNPNSSEAVENWHATYELDNGGSGTIPLSEGSGSPVFYRSLTNENGDTTGIQITFNEPATVDFTAEPTARDRMDYEVASFVASIRETTSLGGLL